MKIVELKKAIKQELSESGYTLKDVSYMQMVASYYDEGSTFLKVAVPMDEVFIDLAEEADEKLAHAAHNKLVKAYGSQLMRAVEIAE